MALTLNGIEPVEIKGRICTPKIDAETRLRLDTIKSYDESADLILASAFPDDESYVRNCLKAAPVVEKELLHAYLIGGDKMVEAVAKSLADTMNKVMDTAIDEAIAEEKE